MECPLARAERRRPAARARRRFSWWWLALPALAIAGYAAFAATLALLGDDGTRMPPPAQEAPRRLSMPAPAPPAASEPVPAAEAAPAPEAVPAPVASDAPAPSATAAQRAAADGAGARKVKPKPAPQEHLTDQDRRALDALVEQAGKKAR
jgi:hypothetical protein